MAGTEDLPLNERGAQSSRAGPDLQSMSDQDALAAKFGPHNALLVKQTMRGCLQECFGCEAKSEFKVAPFDWSTGLEGWKLTEQAKNEPDSMYALEKSSCCCRLCWRDGRPFDMAVSDGAEEGGRDLVHFVKPCGLPLYCSIPTNDGSVDIPCCCFLPKVTTTSPSGESMNSVSKYMCTPYLCVPHLSYSEQDQPVYILKPETCCGGCCIACTCCGEGRGKGCIYLPFYFHDATSGQPVGGSYSNDAPQIRKVWAGLKKECCSTADTFAVKFPDDITPERKAGLLGMTFLLDFTVFERQQDNT